MALPTLLKTWQFDVNNAEASAAEGTFYPLLMFNLKEAMINFATLPWVVKGSSDSVAAGMDDVDRWIDTGDIVWNSGNHSWIVLENAGGAQICWANDFSTNYIEDSFIFFSPSAGFTGGSISARPTATDEFDARTGSDISWWWSGQTGTVGDNVWHMLHSTDGKETRIIGFRANVPHTVIMIGEVQDARAAHTNPFYCGWYTMNYTTDAAAITNIGATSQRYSAYHAGEFGMTLASPGLHFTGYVGAHSSGGIAEELDSELPFFETMFWSLTVGFRGVKGKPADVWWGYHQVAVDGDTYPDNALLRDFFQVGALIFPWTGDATVPVTT